METFTPAFNELAGFFTVATQNDSVVPEVIATLIGIFNTAGVLGDVESEPVVK